MKPTLWYIVMLVVAFLYIYLTAIQYIKGGKLYDANGNYKTFYDLKYYDEDFVRYVRFLFLHLRFTV